MDKLNNIIFDFDWVIAESWEFIYYSSNVEVVIKRVLTESWIWNLWSRLKELF